MHIPAYARATIRAALPTVPSSRQVGALECCLCAEPFGEKPAPVPLGPTPTSGLFGCRPCLRRLVARARRSRDAALVQDADRARVERAAWERARERYVAGVESVREAAEAVTRLAGNANVAPLRIAWLLVSLESAYAWATDDPPEPPASVDPEDTGVRDGEFRLLLEMTSAREAVADRLVYHVIDQATPEEPELCAEWGCPQDCSGRHETEHIDCGPDAVFEDLAEHGVVVERAGPGPSHQDPATTAKKPAADASDVFKNPGHFGMPGRPAAVTSAMERLTALDRSDAPEALSGLGAVEAALLEAPDRLGTAALDWIAGRSLFG